MKRLLLALCLLAIAGAAHAFDPTPARPRIGVLRAHDSFKSFDDALQSELRRRGFDAFMVEVPFEDLAHDPDRDADWYVEVVPGDGDTVDYGGVGIGAPHGGVTFGVLVARLGADVSIWRGRTLELVATDSVSKSNTMFAPTSVGVGTAGIFAAIALPFVERAQARNVTRAVARDIAGRIENKIRPKD